MSPLKDAIAKKDRLTLTQLASYDDILTDTLVDHVRKKQSGNDHDSRPCLYSPDR